MINRWSVSDAQPQVQCISALITIFKEELILQNVLRHLIND